MVFGDLSPKLWYNTVCVVWFAWMPRMTCFPAIANQLPSFSTWDPTPNCLKCSYIVGPPSYYMFVGLYTPSITNSTAQGGGGSFKARKPIGEVGCCESWMAERTHWWIERWLGCRAIYLSIYLAISISIYIYLYLSISIYIYLYLSLFVSIYLYLSISFYIYLYLSISIYIYIYLHIYIYLYLYLCTSIYIYLYLSISIYLYLSLSISTSLYLSLSIYLSIYLSICLCNWLSDYLSM